MMLRHRFFTEYRLFARLFFAKLFFAGLCSCLAALLLACGGGSSQTAGIDGSGAPVATEARGTIDGFGSVIVNGVKYNSDRAEIWINGSLGSEQQLHAGYQVSLRGNLAQDGQANAERIDFVPTLVGDISQVDSANKRLEILGKTVHISNNTLFDASLNLASLHLGQRIMVSGIQAQDGSIRATRLEPAGTSLVQLQGQVEQLGAERFTLRGLEVIYSGATLVNLGSLANGITLAVTGPLEGNTVRASSILGINRTLNPGKADIEGYITRFTSSSDFDVEGIAVITTSQTRYEDGSAADLRLGVKVEVEGRVDSSGRLLAEEIEFEQDSDHKLSGPVSHINLGNSQGIISGSLTVNGLQVLTTNRTRYEDKLLALKRFNLASINLNDWVEVSGYATSDGFIATKIERQEADDDQDEREFEGRVTGVGPDYVEILGQRIYLSEATEIRDTQDALLSLEAFLAIALLQEVDVSGFWQGDRFIATEIELE